MAKNSPHCTYCKDNNCEFKEILNCKHRQLMEENSNLNSSVQDKIIEISKLDNTIGKFIKAFKPIVDFNLNDTVSHDMLGVNAISAIQEAKRLYIEAVENL